MWTCKHVVNLFIMRGGNHWNSGLLGACRGGNLNLVKMFTEKGATNLNIGLAECNKHSGIVEYLLGCGADKKWVI